MRRKIVSRNKWKCRLDLPLDCEDVGDKPAAVVEDVTAGCAVVGEKYDGGGVSIRWAEVSIASWSRN